MGKHSSPVSPHYSICSCATLGLFPVASPPGQDVQIETQGTCSFLCPSDGTSWFSSLPQPPPALWQSCPCPCLLYCSVLGRRVGRVAASSVVGHSGAGITGRQLGGGCSWVWSLVPTRDEGRGEKGSLKAGEKESFSETLIPSRAFPNPW